ncbi:glycosyltransferase [Thermopirellula anaerolimosa]
MARAPIRVMLGITDLDVGGAEKCLSELACRVDSLRFRLSVVSLAPRPRGDDRLVRRIAERGIPLFFLDCRGLRDLSKALIGWSKRIRHFRPDILQTFLFHANFVGRIVGRVAGVPVVISGIRVAERSAKWHLLLDAATSGWVDRYVCVSRSVADFSATAGLLSPRKIVVIPNGVEVDSDCPRSRIRPQPVESFRVGSEDVVRKMRCVTFVGRLVPQKGVDVLLESAATWLRAFPDTTLQIVGDGPQKALLRDMADRLGIDGRVAWLGHRSDVSEILKTTDLFVLPSRWEGMPNALLEAMAAGCPVVTTDVEGVAETLGDCGREQMVPPENVAALSRAIMRMLADPNHAAELGNRNFRHVAEHFRWDRVVEMYESLWEETLTGSCPF